MPEETQSGIKRFPKTGTGKKVKKTIGAAASLAKQSPGITIKVEKKIASVMNPNMRPVTKPVVKAKKNFGISNLKRG